MTKPDKAFAETAETLRNMLLARATGGAADNWEYRQLREAVLEDKRFSEFAPRFLKTCRTAGDFWEFIKGEFPTYAERRTFIRQQFAPLLDAAEHGAGAPADVPVEQALGVLDSDSVRDAWTKALGRRNEDPEGALTSARSLLETVCKHLLDDLGEVYEDGAELPKLYRQVSERLQIAPSQHSEQVFKQILGGCAAVVEGLGALRNRLSDAHGKGRLPAKPAARHAQLGVNLAGSMTLFLVETWQARTAEGRLASRR